MKKQLIHFGLLISTILILNACSPIIRSAQPYQITGTLDYTNAFISMIFEEHAVALVDMYGFVIRDEEWEIPVSSQTLGYMSMDEAQMHAEYSLQLPLRPTGQFVDVDNNEKKDQGVQIFAVSYWPNIYSGPYSEGDDRSRGWVIDFGSVTTDPDRDDEVNGGFLVVWAPDAKQSFPTGYGGDDKLFTDDDPVDILQAGWTIINLDQHPFLFSREPEPVIPLIESDDYALKDYSADSYTAAFDKLLEFLRNNYAFNGIEGKEPDYDALVASLRPRVEEAETSGDAEGYYLALRDLTWAFKDGHVGLDGGDFQGALFNAAVEGGYGFSISELDDGSFVVIYLTPTGPAEMAGMQVGAVITEWNGQPIGEAVNAVLPWALPQSTDWLIRYQQARYLLRASPGEEAEVTFTNQGGQPETVTLKAIAERDSFSRTSVYYNAPINLLPVEFKILDSGVGFVAIYSEADDIQLTIKLFERALQSFKAYEVPGIIIDMRYNGGGTPLGLAGFLLDEEIPLGQSYYYNETSQSFEADGLADKILPNSNQYQFEKIVVLVGPACASACEQEAYGFSQVPGTEVVGMFPSSSMFGEVSRGQFIMPEGFSMQFPTGRYLLPDGSIFLEGTGVRPTIWVPRTLETVSSTDDIVLQYGENSVLLPVGAGIIPSEQPILLSKSQTNTARATAEQFEALAREVYDSADYLNVSFNFTYTITLSESQTLLWAWGWCAADEATLEDNLNNMEISFTLNGNEIPLTDFLRLTYESGGQQCLAYLMGVKGWVGGQHQAVTTVKYLEPINDGVYDYSVGDQVFEYNIYVRP